MDTISGNLTDGRRRRRRHDDEFKATAVTACMQPGISIASVAMAHGINANLLRRWVNDAEMKPAVAVASERPAVAATTSPSPKTSFVPVIVPAPTPGPAQAIHIELRRNATTVTVTWPSSAAAECATWMRELLR